LVVNNNVKLIDFEFAKQYEKKPKSFSEAYELSFIPNYFNGDIPKGHGTIENAYDLFWKSRLRLTKQQFINVDNNLYLWLLMKVNYIKFKIFR
jgi:hypothetical protein